ncbi:uncharacterized protein LOC110850544 [Folsomia candida]|uniref:Transposable element Tcb1 transposase n=1 Tax=Folsomia candida TaxID=158441 RepID=A0A226EA05_FOLCA|nr:uncharacterized protein LOC110850475 [Folsomia candida]XP_021953669.1 uncharacterized protein LOC110850544 [Folsomia candida]OXA54230.1 Transposable element Tcb1 transposase [Folsomia candida]OXA54980.1 Transposable element Tcb1 transposase [Folsomia candida]
MPKARVETTAAQRVLIIKAWEGDEDGTKTPKQISEFLKINYKTVWSIIERYKKTKSTVNKPERKSIFTKRENRSIVKLVKVNPTSSGVEMAKVAEIANGKKSSRRRIGRILKSEGYNNFRAKKKSFVSKKNIKKRLEFAKEHLWDHIEREIRKT